MDEKKVNEQENSDIDHYQVTLNTIVHPEIFNRIVKMVKTGEKYSDTVSFNRTILFYGPSGENNI